MASARADRDHPVVGHPFRPERVGLAKSAAVTGQPAGNRCGAAGAAGHAIAQRAALDPDARPEHQHGLEVCRSDLQPDTLASREGILRSLQRVLL